MQAARGITLSSKNPTFFNSKKVFSEISNALLGKNVRWRGLSSAASVPSDSPKSQSGRKRVTKDERRAMVEAFVDEYRALNGGKYPGPSVAVKQVGGGFYGIRKIIQEIEYNSKQTPKNMTNTIPLVKDMPKGKCQSMPKIEEVSSSETTVGLSSDKPSLRVMDDSDTAIFNKLDDASSNDFVAEEVPPVPIHVEKPLFEEAVDSTKIGDDSVSVSTSSPQIVLEDKEGLRTHTEKPKNSVEETVTSDGSLDLNVPEREVMEEASQNVRKSDELERDMSRKETKEDQLPTRSTMWGNLRSFADGVIKFWRNM